MDNAIWLFLALPSWFFPALQAPFSSYFTAIPASGAIALVLGLVVAAIRREPNVLWALIPAGLSHLYVAGAGLFRGQLEQSLWVFVPFALVELVLVGLVVARSTRSRLAASLVGWFCLTYALYAGLIGAMSLSDTWL